ncbi:IPTL-CTERM sorting domain-containing protein [Sulfidibacter corallicola]|uniref:IPTL-CTERM sorting domain-containing protein n=1 Tax=Sulfidibacter corallicola TaxID=2818388 RepID=A0A8A4TPN5_SULCO|nr:IPTL-CTERM sorting domain-containing protein [Sulfidibacter corallicola]QTD51042.1 IPTL-CTERM sorting domain-containing protein [Sulfidibacter corallicola]
MKAMMAKCSVMWLMGILLTLGGGNALWAQSLSMSFSPDTIAVGANSQLTFTLDNPTASSLDNGAFTLTLPAGVTVSSPAILENLCNGVISATEGGNAITFSEGRLGAFENCSFSLYVTSTTPGPAAAITGDFTSDAGNHGNATDTLTVDADIPRVSMSISPTTILPGDSATVTFNFDNSFPEANANITSFSINFPDNVVIDNPTNLTNDCTLVIPNNVTAGSTNFFVSFGSRLNATETCSLSFDITADTVGTYDFETLSLVTDLGNSGPAVAQLVVEPPPAFSKRFLGDQVFPGDTIDLEFTIDNRDRNNSATGLTFTDNLDATLSGLVATGLPLTDVCGTGSTLSGTSTLTLSDGILGPTESCTFTVTLQVPGAATPGTYPNTTSALTGDSGFNLPAATDDLIVTGIPTMQVSLLDTPPFAPGQEVTVQVVLDNSISGQAAADLTYLIDPRSEIGEAVFTNSAANGFCGGGSMSVQNGTGDAGVLLITGGSLAAGANCTFTTDLPLPADINGGTYTLDINGYGGTLGGVPFAGPNASVQIDVVGAPVISKSFTDDPVLPGGTVTLEYTISLDADAPASATNISFTDDLDSFISGMTATGLPQTDICGAGSSLTGTSTISFSGGTLAPGDSCSFSVQVQVPNDALPGFRTSTSSNVTANVAGVAVTGNPAADSLEIIGLTVVKSFTDDPVVPGGTVTLNYQLTNNSPVATASAISFTENLNTVIPGLTVTNLPLTDPCGAGSSFVGIGGDSFIAFVNGSLAPGASCNFDLTVLVPGDATPGQFESTSSAISANIGGTSVSLPAVIDFLEVFEPLSITKSFTDDPVLAGDTVTLEYTITNDNPDFPATNIAFTDDLNAALPGLVATGLPASNICGAGSSITGTDLVSFTGGTLAANDSCTFSITLQVPGGVPDASAIVSTTSDVTGVINGNSASGQPASDTLIVGVLNFTKAFSAESAPTGTVTLSYSITNPSTTTSATSIQFIDDLDAALSGLVATNLPLTDVCGTGSSLTGTSLVSLSGGILGPTESCDFNITVEVPASAIAGTYPSTTSDIQAILGGLNGSSSPATDNLGINPPPTFAKSFSPNPIVEGGTSTLTFTIDNTASSIAASSLDFTDNLPAGVVIASPANPGLTCTGGTLTAVAGSGTISYSGGSVGAGATCTITVDVTANNFGDYLNTSGSLTSSSGTSGTASDTLRVNPPPAFTKSFGTDPIIIGGTSTLTFTIDNTNSTVDATVLNFTDNLPAGLEVASPANASTTCTGGTLTATAGSGSISYANGSVTAGSTCTITVDVVATAAGSLTNTTGNLTSSLGDSGTATDTIVVNPTPGFSKSFAPNPSALGVPSTLTFTIDNTGSSVDATALDFLDNLPVGMVIASPSNAGLTCTGGTLTAVSGTNSVSYSGGSILASSSCTITVDVVTSSSGDFANTSGNLTSSLGDSGTASDTLRVEPVPVFAKSFSPDSVAVGETTTLTFAINNSGSTSAATGLDFTDNLPAGMVVATPSNANTTCTGGTLTAVAGSGVISYSGGTAAAGSLCNITVDVVATAAGDLSNTSGDLASSLGNSGPASDTLRANPQPLFGKTFAPNPISVGGTTTLTFTIDNTGSTLDATGLDFTDNLPAGLTVASPANPIVTCSGGTLTAVSGTGTIAYSGGTASAGSTCTISVDVTAASSGSFANTSGDLTSNLGNSGTASDTLQVNPAPGFSKSFAPNPAIVDGIVTLTYTIDNTASTAAATALSFTDALPLGLTVATPSNAGLTCTGGTLTAVSGSSSISYDGGTVAAGATCTITVDVTPSAPGDYGSTSGNLTSSLGDSGTASDVLRVNPAPVFNKAFSSASIPVTGTATLTFTIDNSASTADATALDFIDNLPVGLVVASPANVVSGCSGGILTAVAGSGSISYTGGTVGAASSCTISVDVTSDTEGDYVNLTGNLTSSLGDSGTATATLRVNAAPVFTKVFSPDAILPNEVTTLTYTIDNSASTKSVDNLAFTDNLPANVVIAGTPNVTSSCGGTVTAAAGGSTITLAGGSVGPGSTCTIAVDITSGTPGTYTSTSGDLTSTVGNSGQATDQLTVNDGVDLSIAVVDAPDPVPSNDQLTFTVTITNNGPSTAQGVSLATTLPAALTLASSTGCGEDPNGVPTCSIADIPASSSVEVTLVTDVDVDFKGDLTTQFAVTSTTPEINPGDENASETTQVGREADLAITLAGDTEAGPGETIDFTVTARNLGPSNAPDSRIQVTFASELTDVTWTCTSTPGGGTTCSASGSGDIDDTIAIDADATATYTVTATVPVDFVGDLVSDATIATGPNVVDGDQANNSDDLTTLITSPSEVSGTLEFAGIGTRVKRQGPAVQVGDAVSFRAVINNFGSFPQFDDPNSDEFTLLIPEGLDLLNASITSGDGDIVVDRDTDLVTWNGRIDMAAHVDLEITTEVNGAVVGRDIEVQGTIRYDSDGDGVNDTEILTDNPGVAGSQDPTPINVIIPVPTLSAWGLILLVMGLMGFGLHLRRRVAR